MKNEYFSQEIILGMIKTYINIPLACESLEVKYWLNCKLIN